VSEANFQALALLVSVVLAVGGWLFNAQQERAFRKFELRAKYRLEMLEAALEGILVLNKPSKTAEEIVEMFSSARPKIAIFGTDEELAAFERLLSLIEANAGGKLAGNNINEFPKLLVAGFRREVGLPPRSPIFEPKD
jgi:hypothetical protein